VQNAVFMTSYPQHMVFYCLTLARFRQYSSSNLCLSNPAGDRICKKRALRNRIDKRLPGRVSALHGATAVAESGSEMMAAGMGAEGVAHC
jgi:hypothetical protein